MNAVVHFLNSLFRTFFFGNYFYGLCAVALSMEAMIQMGRKPAPPAYLLIVFSVTVYYYTLAYLKTDQQPDRHNLRAIWYSTHRRFISLSQFVILSVLLYLIVVFVIEHGQVLIHFTRLEWLLVLVFPWMALVYYGIPFPPFAKYNLRTIGWIKPLVIGFSWAGAVTIYPLLYQGAQTGEHFQPNAFLGFLFLKNLMFVTMLCIMFDIKDYAMDYNQALKTWVVRLGLRKTIFYILLPLGIAGLLSYLGYALLHGFTVWRMVWNTVPFVAALAVAYSLHNRKAIFYYLVIIDGLMLLKALCGYIGMISI